jgi:hypothetical protein
LVWSKRSRLRKKNIVQANTRNSLSRLKKASPSPGTPFFFATSRYHTMVKRSIMEKPQIVAYLKTSCGWSNGVRAVLEKYELPYEEKDIIQNPAFRW